MASAGNPNQPTPFDVHKLFKPPPSSNPNTSSPGNPPNHSPFPPPTSFPVTPPSYPSPPPGPYSYPPQTTPFHHLHHPFLHYPQDPHASVYQHPARPALPYPSPIPSPTQNPAPNSGARLMALLGTTPPSTLETAVSMPPPSSLPSASSGEFAVPPGNAPALSTVPSAPPMIAVGVPQAAPARLPSSKQPHGRHLAGRDRSVYDVDVRESLPPQLEVTPITKYSSDPGLVLGRQIAVNRSYICYGLRQGNIRVLNINTALRVTDMAFFAEDVHLLASASVDGRIFVWKINEGPDKEDKPQITGRIVVAIQIVSDGELFHPQVCWHCHKQEILVVGIGNRLLKIDMNKVGKGEIFSEEVEPLKCPVDKLIDGVQLIGKHDGEVTDLSMSQWMMTRLASASKDGTVKIWEDRKAVPLATLRPHDGHPVNSVSFLTAPHRPNHIVLITAGPLNREIKIWSSASEEGWLLPSDSESWQCTQTLELRSSAENRIEDAFFNQVVVLPQTSLILLANAKKNAIYAVHIDYGPNPASTRMDYIAEFSVTMPILSITATSDSYADGEQVVQVYCVQTQAIQQYALDLSQCLPPPLDNMGLEKELAISHVSDAPVADGFTMAEVSSSITVSEVPLGNVTSDNTAAVKCPIISTSAADPGVLELSTLDAENRSSGPPLSSIDADTVSVSISPLLSSSSADLSGRICGLKSPSKGSEHGSSLDPAIDLSVVDHSIDKSVESIPTNLPDPCLDENPVRGEGKTGPNDINVMPSPPPFIMGMKATHLVTPSEILSRAVSSGESSHVIHELRGTETRVPEMGYKNDMESVEVEVKVVGESGSTVPTESDSQRESQIHIVEDKSKLLSSQCMESNAAVGKESSDLGVEIFNVEEVRPIENIALSAASEQPCSGEEEVKDTTKDDFEKVSESGAVATITESSTITMLTQSASTVKGKKQKAKQSQASGPSSPSQSPFNSTDSFNVQGNDITTADAGFFQTLSSIQAMLNQVMAIQKDMQNQMSVAVALPVTKEGRRVEVALGRCIEKAIKANNDALWARFQEEIAKREKSERDKMQQITSVISSSLNKDLPAIIEKVLKKENSSLGPALARSINPAIEKVISSAIADSFQKGVGDKAVNQLEKSVNSKLEATVARQIHAQFQTTGKQALQDGLRSSMEASIVPSFELACKAMFEQIDTGFQKGMAEHTTAVQLQLETAHTPLALSLRDVLNSASTVTQTLSNELADGQRKLLALAAAGNPKSLDSMATQQNNVPLSGLHEMVEAPFDPTKELTRLISERKFDEAFTMALQRSDVSIVSWLCLQVDLQGICSMSPLPLSQGVLLSLLQQLSCDLGKETPQKLAWMTQVAVAINPADPMIAMHVRPIFEQVYQILAHQRALPSTTPAESNSIRLMMHVINSMDNETLHLPFASPSLRVPVFLSTAFVWLLHSGIHRRRRSSSDDRYFSHLSSPSRWRRASPPFLLLPPHRGSLATLTAPSGSPFPPSPMPPSPAPHNNPPRASAGNNTGAPGAAQLPDRVEADQGDQQREAQGVGDRRLPGQAGVTDGEEAIRLGSVYTQEFSFKLLSLTSDLKHLP
ncbi:hypothetical protein Taro_018907 [Colocasia esculenta]|uniref:Enhancer of mRNA-decapping protein 4 n=1 Tax=Colocasia esculenta TaxID=4460 RepID=A0A843UXP3_COLES|nr:hypothetical protein [Colocasia esculenta]